MKDEKIDEISLNVINEVKGGKFDFSKIRMSSLRLCSENEIKMGTSQAYRSNRHSFFFFCKNRF